MWKVFIILLKCSVLLEKPQSWHPFRCHLGKKNSSGTAGWNRSWGWAGLQILDMNVAEGLWDKAGEWTTPAGPIGAPTCGDIDISPGTWVLVKRPSESCEFRGGASVDWTCSSMSHWIEIWGNWSPGRPCELFIAAHVTLFLWRFLLCCDRALCPAGRAAAIRERDSHEGGLFSLK